MKYIIEILIIAAVALSIGALTSCGSKDTPAKPHEVLKEQVTQERELREDAESRAKSADSRGNFWEGACLVIFIGACIAFLTGTAVGSFGRKHAN